MFTKKSEPSPLTSARPGLPPTPPKGDVQRPASGSVSQISADLTIIGNLISQGEVQVDGEVQGDLHATVILVGENARVTGNVVANEVTVRGTVQGSVRGNRVLLQSTSKVEGDVFHQQLGIEQGAFFEGKSRRVENPTAGVQRPEITLPPDEYYANGTRA
jgi:cytoskeletal protein CcmA (bactofilin family)